MEDYIILCSFILFLFLQVMRFGGDEPVDWKELESLYWDYTGEPFKVKKEPPKPVVSPKPIGKCTCPKLKWWRCEFCKNNNKKVLSKVPSTGQLPTVTPVNSTKVENVKSTSKSSTELTISDQTKVPNVLDKDAKGLTDSQKTKNETQEKTKDTKGTNSQNSKSESSEKTGQPNGKKDETTGQQQAPKIVVDDPQKSEKESKEKTVESNDNTKGTSQIAGQSTLAPQNTGWFSWMWSSPSKPVNSSKNNKENKENSKTMDSNEDDKEVKETIEVKEVNATVSEQLNTSTKKSEEKDVPIEKTTKKVPEKSTINSEKIEVKDIKKAATEQSNSSSIKPEVKSSSEKEAVKKTQENPEKNTEKQTKQEQEANKKTEAQPNSNTKTSGTKETNKSIAQTAKTNTEKPVENNEKEVKKEDPKNPNHKTIEVKQDNNKKQEQSGNSSQTSKLNISATISTKILVDKNLTNKVEKVITDAKKEIAGSMLPLQGKASAKENTQTFSKKNTNDNTKPSSTPGNTNNTQNTKNKSCGGCAYVPIRSSYYYNYS